MAGQGLRLWLEVDGGERELQGVTLAIRIQIPPEQRRYSGQEAERLWELFGPVDQWARSLRPIPWTKSRLEVGPFRGSAVTTLKLPGTFAPEEAAGKYLAALQEGQVPLELLFSGTLSWMSRDGRLLSAMVPWDREATFRMPLETWRQVAA